MILYLGFRRSRKYCSRDKTLSSLQYSKISKEKFANPYFNNALSMSLLLLAKDLTFYVFYKYTK